MCGRFWYPPARVSGHIIAGLLTLASVQTAVLHPLYAQVVDDEPVIRAIEFEGLRRVEAAAVRILLANREGKPFRPSAVPDDLRAVYGMGYFADAKLFKEDTEDGGIKLTFVITEKPAIRRVSIEGNDDVSTEDIKEVVDIRAFTILSESKVKRNVQKIADLYNEKGFYLAEVQYDLQPLKDNQVEVVFKVIENAKVEVRSIRFVGNRNI